MTWMKNGLGAEPCAGSRPRLAAAAVSALMLIGVARGEEAASRAIGSKSDSATLQVAALTASLQIPNPNDAIYGVRDSGELRWYRHDGRDYGTLAWVNNYGTP